MATEFDDSQHFATFKGPGSIRTGNAFDVRWSEITLASLRAAGFLDNMVDSLVPPSIDMLWLDKNLDPAVLKEWDPIGSNWEPVTSQTLFGRVPWRGPWNSMLIYRRGDLVSYQGSIWIAAQPSQNRAPAEDAYWDLFMASLADDSVTTEKIADGVVPFATKAAAVAGVISPSVHAIELFGSASPGDGLGGLYIDTNDGSADTFTSNGGARQWYRSAERGRDFSISLTVGPLGDYPTISAAMAAASVKGGPRYKSGGIDVDIVLKAGFVMEEQVVADRIDLSWIRIRSEDAIVPMRRSALILPVYGIYYPAFTASRGGGLPSIHCLFEMDDSGSGVNREAFFIVDGSFGYLAPGAGARNVGGRALHVANSSYAVARGVDLRNAGHATPDVGTDIPGAALRNGQSIVEIRAANLSGSTIGIKTAGGAVTDAEETTVAGCRIGIENYNSKVRFGTGHAENCNIGLTQYFGETNAFAAFFDDAVSGAIQIREGGRANLRSCSIRRSGGGQAVYVSGSELFLGNANLENAQGHAISVEGGRVEAVTASLINAGRSGTGYAVNAVNGGKANVQGSDGSGAAGSTGNGVAFMTTNGAEINANGATGSAGRTVNSLSRHGVIYQ